MIKGIQVTINNSKGYQQGVDHGPKPFDVIVDKSIQIGSDHWRVLTIKIHGSSYWVGNYMARSYAPMRYETWLLDSENRPVHSISEFEPSKKS